MKHLKTFEQYSSVDAPVVNEEILGSIAKVFNKIGSSTLDLNMDDAKVAAMASKDNMAYAGGKITKATRWDVIKSYRKQLTDGGVPAELADKAIVLYTGANGWAAPFTFDQKAEKGNILTYKTDKTINVRSGSTSTGAAGVTGAKM